MASFFGTVPLAPPNSILGVGLECKNDPYKDKIDLTIGAYRDNTGKPYVLECVRQAEKMIHDEKLDHEYLSQDGDPNFLSVSKVLMFGEDSKAIKEGRVYTIQGISGTGSLRLASDYIAKFLPNRKCYIPDTTWPNHNTILAASGIPMGTYRYLDSTGCALDFTGLMEDLAACPPGSVVLFHLCAHNPTGVDPSDDQWKEIIELVKNNGLLPFFDNAYQGFVSGCPHKDSIPARVFAETGLEMMVTSSFAKNFGLYGDRIGALHVVASDPNHIPNIASQIRVISRSLWSTCPTHGARIVSRILKDPTLKSLWEVECKGMADRLNSVRAQLHNELTRLNVKGTWHHVTAQRGMFSYTGIQANVVKKLKEDHHIYMLDNGRISLAGLNELNIPRFATALLEIMGSN